MPTALPENIQANDLGHINHTNTMHEARNRIVSVGRGVIYADANNGSDSNDGLSLAYAKQTLAGAEAAAGNGYEIRFMEGAYEATSVVEFNAYKGLRLLGSGGISRDVKVGTRFVAKTNGMTLVRFNSPVSITKEGPEISHIDFWDETPTVNTALLLELDNVNRWQINRCSFNFGDVGLRLSEDSGASGDDNAWNVITGGTHFSKCNTGLFASSGAGFRDFGSEFTGNNFYGMQITQQNCKFFGTFFDGSAVRLDQNHIYFGGVKFENSGFGNGSPNGTGPTVLMQGSGNFNSGNHYVLNGCSFAGYGSNTPAGGTAYIEIESGVRRAVIIGCHWVNPGTRILDNGLDTLKINAQEPKPWE